ncbi:MAG: hypothetical protein MHPSP_003083 [Paramarteilia canceri]
MRQSRSRSEGPTRQAKSRPNLHFKSSFDGAGRLSVSKMSSGIFEKCIYRSEIDSNIQKLDINEDDWDPQEVMEALASDNDENIPSCGEEDDGMLENMILEGQGFVPDSIVNEIKKKSMIVNQFDKDQYGITQYQNSSSTIKRSIYQRRLDSSFNTVDFIKII